jgi:hypothetical protein
MKLRSGFVSNSSSGSFIFPDGISEKKAEIIIRQIEEFLTNLKGEKVESGLESPLEYGNHVVADTSGDNSCPYAFDVILTQVVGAKYERRKYED